MKKLLLALAATAAFSSANAEQIVETLIVDNFGLAKETAYTNVSYTSTVTGITYTGNMCKANASNGNGMQFRTTSNKEAGLVATSNNNGFKIVSVKVTPSTEAATTNEWQVFGNSTAYTDFKNLYSNDTRGTLIGSGTTEATVTPEGDFTFFGFRAAKNAIYIKSIEITYEGSGEVEEKDQAGLSFPRNNYTATMGEEFEAPELSQETNALPEYTSSNPEVATVDASTGAVELVSVGKTTITARTPENESYFAGVASYVLTVNPAVEMVSAQLATTMVDGTYFIGCEKGVAKNYTGTSNYGYLMIDTDVVPAEGKVSANSDYLITFTKTDDGYTMTDKNGKYLGMDASHWGSFNFYATADAENSNCYWDITINPDGNATVSNTGRTGAYLSWKAYKTDFEIVTTDTETNSIQLYLAKTTAIENVAAETSEAPVEYFNLQGVRVANPEGGIFIRRQGDSVSKVVIR